MEQFPFLFFVTFHFPTRPVSPWFVTSPFKNITCTQTEVEFGSQWILSPNAVKC